MISAGYFESRSIRWVDNKIESLGRVWDRGGQWGKWGGDNCNIFNTKDKK